MASSSQTPIPPNPTRWKPNVDPASIIIPGLDTTASAIDQIEQIEQLITIKLQNIDENFSRIHNVLANKLLPAVKRYSVGTEPVREAAKFWTSFYEQAAQIRIPTYDDYSTVNEVPSERDEHSTQEHTSHESRDQLTPSQAVYEPSVVTSETSFLPGQGAISSTPATARLASVHDSFASQASEEPSWSRSLESPLVRLNREISNLNQPEESMTPSTSQSVDSLIDEDESNVTLQQHTSQIPQSNKGKGKETQPLLKNLLRHNLYSASDSSSFESSLKPVSPLKFRGKPKTPTINKTLNPYLSSAGSSVNWSGVVDLRDPSVLTPQKHRPGKPGPSKTTTPRPEEDTDDESFDGLPPGMSPPVLMSPARPPRSSAELGLLKLGQTPSKDFSARIQRDILRSAQRQTAHRVPHAHDHARREPSTSMSTITTPPSLSRYKRPGENSTTNSSVTKDESLESMIRHIRSDIRSGIGATPGASTTPGLRLRPRAAFTKSGAAPPPTPPSIQARPMEQPHFPPPAARKPDPPSEPATPLFEHVQQHQQLQEDLDSDSDSMDEINNTAHPSAAFLMASQRATYDDDSFGSSNHSSDSLVDEVVDPGVVPVHPFAAGESVEDDGFDDDLSDDGPGVRGAYQEETVFGAPPAQRGQASRQSDGQGLRMLGEDLLQDTIGIGAQIAASGRIEESPTPAAWAR